MLIRLKVTCKGKSDFFIPLPAPQPLDVDASSSPAGAGSCSVSRDIQLRSGRSQWAPAAASPLQTLCWDQVLWQLRGTRRPPGGGTMTLVRRWAVRALSLQASRPLANFGVGEMAHKDTPAHLHNEVDPGTSGRVTFGTQGGIKTSETTAQDRRRELGSDDGGSCQNRQRSFPATAEGRVRCRRTPGWPGAPLWSRGPTCSTAHRTLPQP